jgi:hypothetical protein
MPLASPSALGPLLGPLGRFLALLRVPGCSWVFLRARWLLMRAHARSCALLHAPRCFLAPLGAPRRSLPLMATLGQHFARGPFAAHALRGGWGVGGGEERGREGGGGGGALGGGGGLGGQVGVCVAYLL